MKSKMFKLLLGLASTLVVVTVVELGLRVSDYDPNTSPWYRFDPDLGWRLDPVHRRVGGLNSGGFRYPQVSRIKPEGTRRLVNLGDSFSAGINVAYEQTYPGRLADWLRPERRVLGGHQPGRRGLGHQPAIDRIADARAGPETGRGGPPGVSVQRSLQQQR